jgi:hypothetical protein
LAAELRDGLPVPWAYVRREIAREWGVPPWVVDASPQGEVEETLALRSIEARVASRKPPRR